MLILCHQGVENNIQHLCWMQTCLHPDMARKPMYPSTACYLESLVPSLPLCLLFSTVFYFVLEYSFGSDGKESACNARDLGLIFGLGKSLEKGMAIHSSFLAWKIPWTEELGRLQSIGSLRVGHDWAANTFTFSLFTVGYNVVLVSGVQQSESCIYIYTYTHTYIHTHIHTHIHSHISTHF